MAIPTWVTGQVLTASDVNKYFVPLVGIKSADSARSGTGLIADSDLKISVAANTTYHVSGLIIYDGGTGGSEGDFKWQFAVPSGTGGFYGYTRMNVSGSFTGGFASSWGDTNTAQTQGIGTYMALRIDGSLAVASTLGTLQLSWAKNSNPDSTDTHIRAQSFLTARVIGP